MPTNERELVWLLPYLALWAAAIAWSMWAGAHGARIAIVVVGFACYCPYYRWVTGRWDLV